MNTRPTLLLILSTRLYIVAGLRQVWAEGPHPGIQTVQQKNSSDDETKAV
jgi:hypothetical protein